MSKDGRFEASRSANDRYIIETPLWLRKSKTEDRRKTSNAYRSC